MNERRKRRRGQLELRVVFDMNILFTPSATEPLSYEVSKLIKENANQADLRLQWYVPEIVLHERRYQLMNNANELLRATTA